MDTHALLAYCGYLLWLLAGTGDFACHRRTDLPRTSGVAESFAHLLQLGAQAQPGLVGLTPDVMMRVDDRFHRQVLVSAAGP